MNNSPIEVANYHTLVLAAVLNKIDPALLEQQLKKVVHMGNPDTDPYNDVVLSKDDLISMIMMHQCIAESIGLGDQLCITWSAEELSTLFDYKSLSDMQHAYAYKIGGFAALTDEILKDIQTVVEVPVEKNTLAAYILKRSREIANLRV